jgi:hypothetical protein
MIRQSNRKTMGFWMALMSASLLIILPIMPVSAKRGATPDMSSTALKMHKLYLKQPPHDLSLYNALKVSSNATAAQITKSYKQLSRKYHPDKQSDDQNTKKQKLQQIQQAYEILKDDKSRLPYHRYGFTDPSVAIILLMGPARHFHLQDESLESLLQLMGFEQHYLNAKINLSAKIIHKLRVRSIAARLVEQIRPLIEETIQPGILAHIIAKDCDEWKRLPLGAQIIRCVGRGYRHAGNDYMTKHCSPSKLSTDLSVNTRQQWRQAKNFWTALFATGRATAIQKMLTIQEQSRQRFKQEEEGHRQSIKYHQSSLGGGCEFLDSDFDAIFSEDDDIEVVVEEEEEMRQTERRKAQQALLQNLQVEALWKVTKIDLDKTIREACNLILSGEFFFFPSHQASLQPDNGDDGWISSSSGKTIYTDEAKMKAAEAMSKIGEIMVQRSKEGTTWKE